MGTNEFECLPCAQLSWFRTIQLIGKRLYLSLHSLRLNVDGGRVKMIIFIPKKADGNRSSFSRRVERDRIRKGNMIVEVRVAGVDKTELSIFSIRQNKNKKKKKEKKA